MGRVLIPRTTRISPLLYVVSMLRQRPAFLESTNMALKNEQDRLLRAKMIVKKIIVEGKTQQQTAKEMGISHDTVARGLALARQAQVYLDYEQKLYDELVPLAHEAVKMELADGNGDLGLKILQGANIIKTKSPSSKSAQEDEESLYAEIGRLREGSIVDVTPRELPAPIEARAEVYDVSDGLSVGGIYGITETAPTQGESRSDDALKPTEGAQ